MVIEKNFGKITQWDWIKLFWNAECNFWRTWVWFSSSLGLLLLVGSAISHIIPEWYLSLLWSKNDNLCSSVLPFYKQTLSIHKHIQNSLEAPNLFFFYDVFFFSSETKSPLSHYFLQTTFQLSNRMEEWFLFSYYILLLNCRDSLKTTLKIKYRGTDKFECK